MRELKGLEIAARCRIDFKEGVWLVPSQTGSGKYKVILKPGESTCSCDDFQLHQKPCKHIHAARIVRERDGGPTAPVIDTDTIPKRPTYKQDWPAYNLAQTTEKHRFQVLLYDLCQGIPEPERPQGTSGRKPISLADAVFACAFKVYVTFSSRRFGCDLKDAHRQGYLTRPLHPNKVNKLLEGENLAPILHNLIVKSSLPLKTVETAFAPDSTGFSTSRFTRWYDEKYGATRSGHDWVKAHAICGIKTNIVTAVTIEGREAGDSPQFKPLVEKTAENFKILEVPADKAYLSNDNLELVERLGGTAYIPFKSNSREGAESSVWEKMFHYFSLRREEFLTHYHQRSNAESTFGMVKAKFRDHVRSKTDTAMKNEVLCKFLCHNLCCVIMAQCELGIEPVFWPDDQPKPEPDSMILAFPG